MEGGHSIPPEAEEVLERAEPYGDRQFLCLVDGRVVGQRVRNEDGMLLEEWTERDGVRHGYDLHWDGSGRLTFETRYVEGREHGLARQWQEGRLLGSYWMEHGTGLDLWRSSDGSLLEERHCRDGERDGFERWWNGDNRTVCREGHFRRGVPHGVFRVWNPRGRLRRGYPQYFVIGRRVTKQAYLRAELVDSSLPYRGQRKRGYQLGPPQLRHALS